MHDIIKLKPININTNYIRPTLIEIHMADLHFGVIDPKLQYQIYREQILDKINNIKFDILFINGDLYDHKSMSNSDIVLYASMFISDCESICASRNAAMVILEGTLEHDANQLKMFYHYVNNSSIDIRIVENISFHNIKGARILCIPEQYNLNENIYKEFLFNMGNYDMAVMHGVYNGAVYNNNSGYSKVFNQEDFIRCTGPIIGGHVHTPGCYDKDMYYTGSPLRFAYGQEEEKGFMILVHNLETRMYFPYMEFVKSFRYDTVDINDLITNDPKDIIHYIDNLKQTHNIDNLRIKFTCKVPDDFTAIVKNYYRTKNNVDLMFDHNTRLEKSKENILKNDNEFNEYDYLLDKNPDEFDIFSRYVNQQEGYVFITADELKKEMEEEI